MPSLSEAKTRDHHHLCVTCPASGTCCVLGCEGLNWAMCTMCLRYYTAPNGDTNNAVAVTNAMAAASRVGLGA